MAGGGKGEEGSGPGQAEGRGEAVAGGAMVGGGGGIALARLFPPQPLSMSAAMTRARMLAHKGPLNCGRT